ncbi:STAS domain-containing protein [Streptomyces bungoensis]|uniref:STAS domain-containing protein n=1 Tax=Streptomyces bungoensis TaxID=285568 RepID=UPI0033F1BB87
MPALMARAPVAGKPLRQQLRESADYDTASFAGAQGEDLINRGCTTLVLHVECMDSSGIGTVIALSRTFDHGVGTLHLAALNAHYEQVRRMFGLEEVSPVSRTVNAALQTPVAGDVPGTVEAIGQARHPIECTATTSLLFSPRTARSTVGFVLGPRSRRGRVCRQTIDRRIREEVTGFATPEARHQHRLILPAGELRGAQRQPARTARLR